MYYRIHSADARVTAMSADSRSLWVGTHGGFLLLIDPIAFTIVLVTKRYTWAVRSLQHVNKPGNHVTIANNAFITF